VKQNPSKYPAIAAADMRNYLATQDDLRLELAALKACTGRGWRTRHGGFYSDPLTKKMRQFDIRAYSENGDMRVYLPIECKALSTSFPLLVSRMPRIEDESFHEVLYSHRPIRKGQFHTPAEDEPAHPLRMDNNASPYRSRGPVGKHSVQIRKAPNGDFETSDAETFDKWSQALASADDLVHESTEIWKNSTDARGFSVVLPVLVVADETLWVVDYDAGGAEVADPRVVESAEVFVGRSYVGMFPPFNYEVSHLHIVTLAGLTQLLDSFGLGCDGWADWFPNLAICAATGLKR
jgi:hypothetical protein